MRGAVLALLSALVACSPLLSPIGALTAQGAAGKDAIADSLSAVFVLLLSDTGEPLVDGRIDMRPAAGGDGGVQAALPIRGASGPRALTELGDGRYAHEQLPPGVYRLRASAAGHEERTSTVWLRTGERREITLRLSRRPLALPEIVAAARAGTAVHPGRMVDFVSFRERPPGAATLSEWLEGLPAVHVRRSASGRQLVSVRGSRPEGVLVLLDGVPINDPLTGVADLTGIPTSALESATLIRGAGPEFGPNALAGVLVLRSGRGDAASGSLGLETGSHGRRAADAHLSAGGSPGRLALSLRLEEAENDFGFENRLLPGNPREVRRNADTHRAHASLAVAPAALPVLLRLRLDELEQGAPGRMGTALFDEARWEEDGVQIAGEVGGSGPTAVGSYRRRALRYRDPRAGRDETQVVEEFHLRGDLPLPADWRLSGRLERASVEGDAVAPAAGRLSAGAALSGRWDVGAVRLVPGAALDVAEEDAFWSPSLAMTVKPWSGWTVWSRAGQALRLPAFGDRYTGSSPRVRPNPELRPERVIADLELGGSWTKRDGRGGARLAFHHRHTVDPIVWLASAVAVWSPRNLDRLTAEGVEADAFWEPSKGWRLEAAASLERSRVGFGSNRNPLPYAPGAQGRVMVDRNWGNRALRFDARVAGSRTTSLAGTHRLPGIVLFDVSGRQEVSVEGLPLTLDARLRNVLDTPYELVSLVPEPGRVLELRLQVGPLGWSAKRPTGADDENLNRER